MLAREPSIVARTVSNCPGAESLVCYRARPVIDFRSGVQTFNAGQKISGAVSSPIAIRIWIGIFIAFGIFRNLSAFSFP